MTVIGMKVPATTRSYATWLEILKADDVTWQKAGEGFTYRFWVGSSQYERCTGVVKSLVKSGRALHKAGYEKTRGEVELTKSGYDELMVCRRLHSAVSFEGYVQVDPNHLIHVGWLSEQEIVQVEARIKA